MIYQISKSQNESFDSFLIDCENYLIDFFMIDKKNSYVKKKIKLFLLPSKSEYQEMTQTDKYYAVAHASFYEKSIYAVTQENIRDEYDACKYKKMLFHELTHIYSSFFITSDYACSNQYLIPWWLGEGISVCISRDVDDVICCNNINTLFDKNISPNVAYMGGGVFVNHILKKYGKEKFLKFLSFFRNIKSKNEVDDFFIKIYKRSLKEELKLMCQESVANLNDYTDENFKEKLENNINTFKIECEDFLKTSLISPSINILSSRDELCKKYEMIFNESFQSECNFFVDVENNEINVLKIDPFSTYIIEDSYFNYLYSKIFNVFLNQFYDKNVIKFLPQFLVYGVGVYLSKYLKIDDIPEDIHFILNNEEKNLFFLQKAGVAFIKYLIETYSKETFLEFLKSLRNNTSKEETYEKFEKVYKKDARNIIQEIVEC